MIGGQQASLRIQRIEATRHSATVYWDSSPGSPLLNTLPLELQFLNRRLAPADVGGPENLLRPALFACLFITVPFLCLDYRAVVIELPFALDEYDRSYFEQALQRLGLKSRVTWETPAQSLPELVFLADKGSGVGLLYGGGIESNSALSKLIDRKPLLLSIIGERWMNNPLAGRDIKYRLEQDLCNDFGLDIAYVAQNGREIMNTGDVLMNQYCTGGFFYWLMTPHALAGGLRTCYISQELEYTLIRKSMDYSLTPMFLFEIAHRQGPMLVPVMGWYSSVELLDQLRGTPFVRYIYSCFRNTGQRWCGECTKCYRVNEFCQRLGIPRELIGMQEGIPAAPTQGTRLYELHWRTTNLLYPRTDQALMQQTDVMVADICQQGRYELRNLADRSYFRQEMGHVFLHPGSPGSDRAELRLSEVLFEGHNAFKASVEVRNEASAPVLFQVEVMSGDSTVLARGEICVQGGEKKDFEFDFPPLFGPCDVILSTQMAAGASSSYCAWAYFDHPVFRREPVSLE